MYITYDQVWMNLLSLVDELHSMICLLYKNQSLGVKVKVYLETYFWSFFFKKQNKNQISSLPEVCQPPDFGVARGQEQCHHRSLDIGFSSEKYLKCYANQIESF